LCPTEKGHRLHLYHPLSHDGRHSRFRTWDPSSISSLLSENQSPRWRTCVHCLSELLCMPISSNSKRLSSHHQSGTSSRKWSGDFLKTSSEQSRSLMKTLDDFPTVHYFIAFHHYLRREHLKGLQPVPVFY
jgi:hypothetical protein